ncbi:hypothetical protein HN873_003382, partial [Arachis hypogaea]
GKVPSLTMAQLKSFLDQKKKIEKESSIIEANKDIGVDDLDFGVGNKFGKWMRLHAQYLDDVRLLRDVEKNAVGQCLQ